MSVFALYKPFRNKLAGLSLDESLRVIWAYSQYLQMKDFRFPNDIEVSKQFTTLKTHQAWIAEWDLEVLAKEVILNAGNSAQSRRSLKSWRHFAQIVNALKYFGDQIYDITKTNIFVELSRIAHRQFVWQQNRPGTDTAIRYYKIFNQYIINQLCQDTLGMSVTQIYLIGMGLIAIYLEHPALLIPFSSDVSQITEEVFCRFIALSGQTVGELKPLLRAAQRYDGSYMYAYNPLREYPLIKTKFRGSDAIICPLPTLLFWRFTGGLYYDLIGDARFSQAFGASFQAYVGDVIRSACPRGIHLTPEQPYGTKKGRKDSVDWIVHDTDAAIFLECKAKRLTWGAKAAFDDLQSFESDFSQLANAIIQTYLAIVDCQSGRYPHFAFEMVRKVYPVVVTLEDWHLFGPALLSRLEEMVMEKLVAHNLDPTLIRQFPYSVWCAQDLEDATQIMNRIGISPYFSKKIDDAEMARWEWHAYNSHCYQGLRLLRELFATEFDAIFSKATQGQGRMLGTSL